ncbi:tRNA (adenosine(37)-N6)-threonylcarbamoyltransferase complex transferase subunit TsaD [candidate division TA06 bacterium]|uniref:tRNA N6-adenosine threonylcarbamoyltransferase n=1 Tax=candidate division TA06 bacterium TaxID=2250710 RepID=A0A933ML82_UNCT6|nr:tRNA (adenosine(37)-N6)-threonylcarbamoyltransferase complex transferase subunit TsaD [candidate division TA06 bacterium]
MMILGIETSCDETAAAVVRDGKKILSNVIHSQTVHRQYGGVVPELASRDHLKKIVPVVREALTQAGLSPRQIDAVAATSRPGLAGALLVGFCFARGLAQSLNVPFVSVNHVEAHAQAAFLDNPELEAPAVALVVSGGHTSLFHIAADFRFFLMGQTLDDAAGEAFDKVAKLLGLGYPGGPAIEQRAKLASSGQIVFPKALLGPQSLDFSFSGLKTAVLNYALDPKNGGRENMSPERINDICRGFQTSVCGVLTEKVKRACELTDCRNVIVAGGVAANGFLRQSLAELERREGLKIVIPGIRLCTDNAAMVAACGTRMLDRGQTINDNTVQARVIWPKYQNV